jgi:hypothetical protein
MDRSATIRNAHAHNALTESLPWRRDHRNGRYWRLWRHHQLVLLQVRPFWLADHNGQVRLEPCPQRLDLDALAVNECETCERRNDGRDPGHPACGEK